MRDKETERETEIEREGDRERLLDDRRPDRRRLIRIHGWRLIWRRNPVKVYQERDGDRERER